MGELTATQPKPLLKLNDLSLIEHQLSRLAAAGIADVVINLSYRGEQIRELVGDGRRFGLSVRYSEEPAEPLETAGGIIQALPLLGDEPFLVVNADVVSDFDPGTLQPPAGSGTLVMVANPPHHPEGDYGLDQQSRLNRQPPLLTYSGIALLKPELFAGLAPGRRPLSQVFETAIAAGQLYGVVHDGLWMDVGTPERLHDARAVFGGEQRV